MYTANQIRMGVKCLRKSLKCNVHELHGVGCRSLLKGPWWGPGGAKPPEAPGFYSTFNCKMPLKFVRLLTHSLYKFSGQLQNIAAHTR